MEPKKSTKPGAKRTYWRYDDHFKAEAVRQLERGVSVSELSVSRRGKPSLLHNWKAKAKQPAVVLEQAAEVKRLTKQLKAREQEIEILKKPCAFSAKDD